MASWTGRKKTVTWHEWAVPVGPYGTDYEELTKAHSAAHRKAAEASGRMDAPVRVFVGDDEIIFRVEEIKLERPEPVYRNADGTEARMAGTDTQIIGLPVIPRTGGPGSPTEDLGQGNGR